MSRDNRAMNSFGKNVSSLFSLHTGSTTTTNASLDRAEGTNGDLAADNCDVAAEETQARHVSIMHKVDRREAADAMKEARRSHCNL